MASTEDKKAAKALIKLGHATREEAVEFLEAVDEIEPAGGLLGLLEEEGSLSAEDLVAVKKEMSRMAGATTIKRRAPKAQPKQAEPEEEEEKPGKRLRKKGATTIRRREGPTKVRRRASEEEAQARSGGKGKLVLAGVALLVLVVAGVVAVVAGFGGSNGGAEGGGDGGAEVSDPDGKGADLPEPGMEPGPAEPGGSSASSPGRKPRIPPMTLRYRFSSGLHIVYQSESEVKDESNPENRLHSRKDVNEFIDTLGDAEKGQKVCIERQVSESRTTGNKPTERFTPKNKFDFLVLTTEGTAATERSGGAEELLWILVNPVFPAGGEILNGTWTLERESKDGRFELRYDVEDLADGVSVDGTARECVRITVEARFPGGAPPSSFRLDRADGTIWFDADNGLVVKGEGYIDSSDAASPADAEPQVKRWVKRSLLSVSNIDSRSAEGLNVAGGLYFGVMDMVYNRQYAKAQKRVNTAEIEGELDAKYLRGDFVSNLKAMIPEVRMSQQAGAAMRDRTTTRFRNTPWRRPDRPPAMLTGDTPRRDGKRRTIPLEGKSVPIWLKKYTKTGKTNLVYFVTGHFSSSFKTARLAVDMRAKFGSVKVTGVLFEADQRKLFQFIGGIGKRLNHQIKLDGEMKAVREGKLEGVPAIFVVDGSGKVTYAQVGFFGETTKTELEGKLR